MTGCPCGGLPDGQEVVSGAAVGDQGLEPARVEQHADRFGLSLTAGDPDHLGHGVELLHRDADAPIIQACNRRALRIDQQRAGLCGDALFEQCRAARGGEGVERARLGRAPRTGRHDGFRDVAIPVHGLADRALLAQDTADSASPTMRGANSGYAALPPTSLRWRSTSMPLSCTVPVRPDSWTTSHGGRSRCAPRGH